VPGRSWTSERFGNWGSGVARMERPPAVRVMRGKALPATADTGFSRSFIIGPAEVPTRWLHPGYKPWAFFCVSCSLGGLPPEAGLHLKRRIRNLITIAKPASPHGNSNATLFRFAARIAAPLARRLIAGDGAFVCRSADRGRPAMPLAPCGGGGGPCGPLVFARLSCRGGRPIDATRISRRQRRFMRPLSRATHHRGGVLQRAPNPNLTGPAASRPARRRQRFRANDRIVELLLVPRGECGHGVDSDRKDRPSSNAGRRAGLRLVVPRLPRCRADGPNASYAMI